MIGSPAKSNIQDLQISGGRRTPTAVSKTRRALARKHLVPAFMFSSVCLSAAIFAGWYGVWSASFFCCFLAVFLAVRAATIFRVHNTANKKTCGLQFSDNLDDTAARKVVSNLSSHFNVEKPEFEYQNNSFSASYNPNTKTITLGRYLGFYESDLSILAAVHEFSHHLLLYSNNTKRKWLTLLEVAGTAQILMVFCAVMYPILLFIVQNNLYASWAFTFFIVFTVLQKGILTAHELEVNDMMKLWLKQNLFVLNEPENRDEAYNAIKLGEHTYIVDFAGWVIITILIMLF